MIISIQLAYIDSSGAELVPVTAPSLCTSNTRHVTSDELYSSRQRVTAASEPSFTSSTESVRGELSETDRCETQERQRDGQLVLLALAPLARFAGSDGALCS